MTLDHLIEKFVIVSANLSFRMLKSCLMQTPTKFHMIVSQCQGTFYRE